MLPVMIRASSMLSHDGNTSSTLPAMMGSLSILLAMMGAELFSGEEAFEFDMSGAVMLSKAQQSRTGYLGVKTMRFQYSQFKGKLRFIYFFLKKKCYTIIIKRS